MNYKSPVELFIEETRIERENEIYKAIQRVGVNVDKDELIKALAYDRDQYYKGYLDGYNANKWNSVEDTLPAESGIYLVCTAGKDVYTTRFHGTAEQWWGTMDKVTHWMPLPEPCEEG